MYICIYDVRGFHNHKLATDKLTTTISQLTTNRCESIYLSFYLSYLLLIPLRPFSIIPSENGLNILFWTLGG